MRIPHAYYSRVSNATVLETAGHESISHLLRKQQMNFMGELARRGDDDAVRRCVFLPGGIDLRTLPGPRRRGRPRISWATSVYNACIQLAGSHENLSAYFQRDDAAERAWQAALRHFYT